MVLIALPCLGYVWLMKSEPTKCLEAGVFCRQGAWHTWCVDAARSGTSSKANRDSEAHTVLSFFGVSVASLLWLACSNPGIIPAAAASKKGIEGEEEKSKPALKPSLTVGEPPLHLCRTCQIYKPAISTHHCR